MNHKVISRKTHHYDKFYCICCFHKQESHACFGWWMKINSTACITENLTEMRSLSIVMSDLYELYVNSWLLCVQSLPHPEFSIYFTCSDYLRVHFFPTFFSPSISQRIRFHTWRRKHPPKPILQSSRVVSSFRYCRLYMSGTTSTAL
jgi:hypothetical protein